MGPIALFDKSFLQSLNVDESVWFDHFFLGVVAPFFYLETLADLGKPGMRSDVENRVRALAEKFPDMHGRPCVHHVPAALGNLFGQPVPMTGQVPIPGGFPFEHDGASGVAWDEAPESQAFARWQSEDFLALEKEFATEWREALSTLPLDAIWSSMQAIGVGGESSHTLEEAKCVALNTVRDAAKSRELLELALLFLGASYPQKMAAVSQWKAAGSPHFCDYAPYAAYVLSVEIFFQVAIAASLIARERPSNRIDIAYLYYLPFCMVFVSSDKLHRRCATLFLRDDQEFIWGPDLKADLSALNQHFLGLPHGQRPPALLGFSGAPPRDTAPTVERLWHRYMSSSAGEPSFVPPSSEAQARTVDRLNRMRESAFETSTGSAQMPVDPDALIFKRSVRRRRGSWLQVPDEVE